MLIQNIIETINNNNNVYVHGGPDPLDGNSLKRYGKRGQDMGALFFSKYNNSGIKYSMGYAIHSNPKSWALYLVKINIPTDQIFDFTNKKHRMMAKSHLSPNQFDSWVRSSGSSGHLDWTSVDDELFEEMGFRAALFHERPANFISDDAIISIGVFNASDVKIIEKIPAVEARKRFKEIYNNMYSY